MRPSIVGLHHVTAIASDPQRTLNFYTQTLGLRFVKRTVNFDDPGTYHFYFGDDTGQPGTILTFFPWPGVPKGKRGTGETVATAFSIPLGSLNFWQSRLKGFGVPFQERTIFGVIHLTLEDPDGMVIELVEHADTDPGTAPRYSDIPAADAIQGLFGVTLQESQLAPTQSFLGILGYQKLAEGETRSRYAATGEARGRYLDIIVTREGSHSRTGAGSVHHIAFRASDDAAQTDWRLELGRSVSVTPVQDRTYFHSIYFHEPGGTLFEIATDAPGFMIDEPVESLGERLCIPNWLEGQRAVIESHLLPIKLHRARL